MAQGPRYHMAFKRRRKGKTDFRSRLALLKSGKVRAVVRRSLTGPQIQMVSYDDTGDRIVTQASYVDLKKLGWKHSLKDTTACYLVGLIAGKRAHAEDISEAVLDIGLQEPTKGGRVFAALKGLLDAGIEIPHGDEMIPEDDRISGKARGKEGLEGDFEAFRTKIMEM